jgi:hypothetical protein
LDLKPSPDDIRLTGDNPMNAVADEAAAGSGCNRFRRLVFKFASY